MLTAAVLFLAALYFAYLTAEARRAARDRAALSHIVHVNGTRGKSSVSRLIEAGLRAGGLRVFCKTTGTDPMTIDVSGREEPIRRRGRDAVWDVLFCAASSSLCFLLALREENGRLAGGQLLGGLLGFCLYLHLLSPLFLPTLERCALFWEQNWKPMKDRFKKRQLFRKKLFQNQKE